MIKGKQSLQLLKDSQSVLEKKYLVHDYTSMIDTDEFYVPLALLKSKRRIDYSEMLKIYSVEEVKR